MPSKPRPKTPLQVRHEAALALLARGALGPEEDADVRARTPAAMVWVNVLARTIAVVVQVAVGAAIFISVIGVHPWIPGLGMIAWIGGIILMHRWWSSHPGRVVGVPLVLAAAYFLLVVIADRFGLVGA